MNLNSYRAQQSLLKELSDLNIPLGLVTSATRADQERAFTKFGLFPLFLIGNDS